MTLDDPSSGDYWFMTVYNEKDNLFQYFLDYTWGREELERTVREPAPAIERAS
ncbi:hypothetical protein VIN01S_24510 [Vibrio inusitatus NBRC 102082]|uniref:Uncharacterized protein n=1 Tax=Vibrio inusitatus NBRC 102082 TaxID=1219070 RepID=A0A4Y3HX38_9VIBR|nr:hypothetical protein [Vibrio inusitatus]GEA51647.1 hypothetical protein VIN01S_24510 [Vibrio inusitatus NBRC 102082]